MRGFGMSARMARRTKVASAVAASTCAVLLAPSMAAATDITVNDDAAGPGPAGANCAAPDHATITAAVAAASASGDRVLVCAGTYTQPQILIDKSLDLIGAGAGQSIIDGGDAAMPSAGLIRTNDSTNGDVLVQDFTVQNVGAAGGTSVALLPKGNDPGTTQDFNRIEVIGEGVGGADYGLDADNPDPDVILRNSSITGTEFNPVLIERVDGAVTIRDNEIAPQGSVNTSSIFAFTYSGDSTSNPVRIVDNSVDANSRGGIVVQTAFPQAGLTTGGTMNSVEISDNVVEDFSSIGISVYNADDTGTGLPGEIANVDIARNSLTDNDSESSIGLRLRGRVRNVSVRSNVFEGLGTGVALAYAPAEHTPIGVEAHFNRIVGNATAGMSSEGGELVDAEHNWWGCNEGPGAAGCDTVFAEGPIDFDPWLVLGLTAAPETIAARGATATLVADLTTDSDGEVAGPGFPEGTPVGFATTLGTVQTPVGTADGTALSTLASGNEGGVADVTATLDNASATAQVGIDPPPPDPREVEPTPRDADLKLTVTPKRRTIEGGKTVGYIATVRNAGETTATETVLCARVPKNLTLAGDGCAEVGDLAPGEDFTIRFTVSAPDIPKRTFRVRFNAAAANAKGAKTRAKLKVRD